MTRCWPHPPPACDRCDVHPPTIEDELDRLRRSWLWCERAKAGRGVTRTIERQQRRLEERAAELKKEYAS